MSIDFKKAYFAIVSIISVIALAFSAVELIGMAINFIWPELAMADLERIKEFTTEKDGMQSSYLLQKVQPLNTTIVSSLLRLVVFSVLLWLHLPRLLDWNRD